MKNPQSAPLLRLHGLFPYDRSGKVRWLLTELKLDFENRWLNREDKEFESPEFLHLNPMGQIPVLEMGDQVIFESGAICAYLADLYPEQGLAPSLTDPARADYQKWMYFAASTLDPIQTRIMIIEDIPASPDQAKKEEAVQQDLSSALQALDQVLAKNSHLISNRFTAADICVSYHLSWCRLWPELDLVMQKYPRILSYLERLKNLPSAKAAGVFSYESLATS